MSRIAPISPRRWPEKIALAALIVALILVGSKPAVAGHAQPLPPLLKELMFPTGGRFAPFAQQADQASLKEAREQISLGRARQQQGDFAGAEQAFKRALAIMEKALGPDAEANIEPLLLLTMVSTEQNHFDDAIAYAQRALKIAERHWGVDDPDTINLRETLALVYMVASRYEESLVVHRQVLASRDRIQGPDHPSTVRTLVAIAQTSILAERFMEAEVVAKRAVAAREKALGPNDPKTAEAVGLLGHAYAGQGRYREAEPIVARAVAIFEKTLGGEPQLAQHVALQVTIYSHMARYADAEKAAKRSLALYQRLAGPEDALTAKAFDALGLVYWEMGRYFDAEPLFRQAIAVFEKVDQDDGRLLGAALNNLAVLQSDLGRSAEAEALLKRALALLEKKHGATSSNTAAALQNLAVFYAEQGRYEEADTLQQRALSALERTLGADHPKTALALANQASFLDNQERFAEADALRRRALATLEKMLGVNHPSTAAVMTDHASSLAARGRFGDAEALLRRATGAIEVSLGPDHPALARTLSDHANALAGLGRLAEAEQAIARALKITEKAFGQQHHQFALELDQLSDIKWRQGRRAEAEQILRRAVAILKQVFAPSDPDLITVHETLSKMLLALDRPADSVATAREALSLQGRRNIASQPSRAKGRRHEALEGRSVSIQAIRAMFALAMARPAEDAELLAEAFEAAQSAEVDETGEAMARMASRFAAGTGALASLLREQQLLQTRLARLDERLADALSAMDPAVRQQADRFRAERASTEARLDEIDAALRRDHRAYADLLDPRPMSLADAQKLLGESEAIVVQIVSADAVYSFAASGNAATWAKSPVGVKDLSKLVATLRRQLDPDQWQASFAPFDRGLAHAFYSELWAPLERVLSGKTQIFVVPMDALTSLPLSVLVTEAPAGGAAGDANPQALRDTAWLVKRHALTTLPSISSLKALRLYASKGSGTEPFAGFGDPALGGGQVGARSVASVFRGASPNLDELRTLSPLPGTGPELKALAKALGASETTDVYLRERATEAQLKTANLTRKRVIAFATHALTAGDLGLGEPGLVFTPPGSASERDDGYLSASEAATLDLRADWIILSACNTAAGDAPGAKGLSGLARAFFLAGARSLLVSHWPVWDDAAGRITTTAVKSFQANPAQGRAEALRQASLALMVDTSSPRFAHPAAWAPFVLVGEQRAN